MMIIKGSNLSHLIDHPAKLVKDFQRTIKYCYSNLNLNYLIFDYLKFEWALLALLRRSDFIDLIIGPCCSHFYLKSVHPG